MPLYRSCMSATHVNGLVFTIEHEERSLKTLLKQSGSLLQKRIAWILRSPHKIIVGGFGAAILVGTVLLMLPFSQHSRHVGIVEAFFTATSAVCVTGLTVVDTGSDFSRFGQGVILLLIQVGGLGIMSLAAMAFQLTGKRMSMQSRALLSDSLFQTDLSFELRSTFRTILLITVVVESLGTLLLYVFLPGESAVGSTLFFAVFHSVSAFCNAGFSTRSDSLVGLKDNLPVLFTIMGLVVVGGLGYAVLVEIQSRAVLHLRSGDTAGKRRLSTHARLVLLTSSILVAGGTLALFLFGTSVGQEGIGERLLTAVFHSVSSRTAGFNTADLSLFSPASLAAVMVLMFIGGSPASCAGGVKTTTMAVWLARLRASLHGKTEVNLLGRGISVSQVSRADLVMGLAVFWNIMGIFVLLNTDAGLTKTPLDLIFEQFSAFGTVGLSTGLTAHLSTAGKLWLCASMFVGRVGPLTAALWMFPPDTAQVRYPETSVMIG